MSSLYTGNLKFPVPFYPIPNSLASLKRIAQYTKNDFEVCFFHCLCVVKNQHVKWLCSLRPERGSRRQRCRSSALFFSCVSVGSPSICWDSVSPKPVPEAFTVCYCSRAAGIQGFIFIGFDHSMFMRQHSLCW